MQKYLREEGFEFSDSGLQLFFLLLLLLFHFKKIVFYCKFDFAILLILWTILPNFFDITIPNYGGKELRFYPEFYIHWRLSISKILSEFYIHWRVSISEVLHST